MQFIQFQSQDPNSLSTPSAGNFNIFVDQTDNTLKIKDNAGEVYGGGGGYSDTTYSELVSAITTSGLTAGSFYLITDFRTCYDQPDFDVYSNPITTGATKQAAVEPIMVFATSISTISTEAYQPLYPNDRIQYDWTFSATEVTNSTAFGRITERIDEFNNRTDYDHRTIKFKRYRLYTYREELRLNGTASVLNDGTVNGTNTSFTALTVGDVVYIPSLTPTYYEIVDIAGDTTMTVSGDTIGFSEGGSVLYLTVEETNGSGYFSYKRTNVKTNDFIEYTTFGDAISQEYAKNNYVGNYANNYSNVSSGTFILANNVFLEGPYDSNKYGDSCYDNTFGSDLQNNIWADRCYRNVSTNDIDYCIIGHDFFENIINTDLTNNHIGNDFKQNMLLAENYSDFRDNIIGNDFNSNTIYSSFYDNQILNDFNNNTIGDFGNVDTDDSGSFNFYRNRIANNFNNNIIRKDFQNNAISTNFNSNTINGEFQGNTILNGFNSNEIGDYFSVNQIGNAFNDNKVESDFYNNTTDYYFNNNLISYGFYYNNIKTYFTDNKPSNHNFFNWANLTTVETRSYDVFYDSTDSNLPDNLLGREFVMRVISTSQYFKIKFTQWTQNNGGGGFQYERQEIDSNGNTIGDVIIFTKKNYESMVDVIVEGVVEITRDNNNNNGIYNIVTEGGWNSSVSPEDTEWNSIYTEPNNGRDFRYNKIDHEFQGNKFGNYFQDNQIGNYFDSNDIKNNFRGNVIGSSFQSNIILDGFGFGGSQYRGNKIGNYFNSNEIGEYFYDNTIIDNFDNNTVSDNFRLNMINTPVESTTLTSCVLYSAVTVNVFKNSNGDNRLSYYDGSDVLTIETLIEPNCPVISFTITSGDFTFGGEIDSDTTPLGVDGVDGFENTDSQNILDDGYYGNGLGGDSLTGLTAAYNTLGLALDNSTGYIWNVTWGEGSTIESGLVKFGANVDGEFFRIQAIDENDTDWQSPNNDNGTSLVGTFLFPATFTAYLPLINKSGWC